LEKEHGVVKEVVKTILTESDVLNQTFRDLMAQECSFTVPPSID